jgi:chromosome segregation ATPase
MSDDELSARVRAVERALTDGDTIPDFADAADVERRLDELESEMETLADRVDALDATVQSLHGYVGDLEHVNDRVERRADAARAAVERLEGRQTTPGASHEHTERDSTPVNSTPSEGTSARRVTVGDDEIPSGYDDGRHSQEANDEDESLFGRVRDAL